MAVTNGWGQAAKNNTNGYGKLATNNIGAGSIYEDSYAGDTALIGVSAAFSYSASTFTQADSNPTPTITGTTGGTFSGTSGLVFVSTSTGEIDLSASTIAAHVVTYTVSGVSSDFSLSVTAAPFSNQFSFEFDGVDEFFDLGTSNTLEFTNNFSISLWIKETTTSLNRGILVVGDFGNSHGYRIQRTSSNKIAFHTAARTATSTTSINTGDWFHVVAIWETSVGGGIGNRNRIYINGVLEGTATTGVAFPPTYTGTIYKQIAYPYNTTGNEFAGNIDEVSLWNTNLSSTAVTEIYNSGVPNNLNSHTNVSNLISWYRMGEEATFSGGNWTLTDQGSGGNNATSNNMDEADRKTNTPASFNQFSFSFDGIDENFQTSSKLINTDFTLSFWINANGSYAIHQAQFPVSITPSNTTAPNETIGRIIKNGTTLQASIQCFDSTGSGFSTYILDAPTLEGAGWNHLLFTYNKTTKHIFCYLNGTRRDWQKNPTNPTKHQCLTAISSRLYESDLTIGRNKPGTSTGTFNGLVDEVSTFNSILSQTDINTIYGTGSPTDISSLNPVAWYRMGEEATFSGGSWTLTDQGSGGNNATSNNMEETDRKADTP